MKKILLVLLIIILFSGCGKKKEVENKISEEKEIKKQEEEKIKIIDLESKSRPYAVMINNLNVVWGYQCGLQDAYIVYEMLVEGGLTRLMAIFKDVELERIGSVRSSRHYFLDYVSENDALYIHFGWSSEAEKSIKELGINNVNFLHYEGYTRDYSLGLAQEHTAFTTTKKIMDSVNYYGYRTTSDNKPLLNYSGSSLKLNKKDGVKEANEVYIAFSTGRNTSFVYDKERKIYNRFQNGVAQMDYVTKKQYTVKNIITYKLPVTFENSNVHIDDQDYQNIGKGNGWYISEGVAVPITWQKDSRTEKTIYKYKNGKQLVVNDGNTHIEIQPNNMELTIK